MAAKLNDLFWWLLWACAVPMVTFVICSVILPPRIRHHVRNMIAPLKVTVVRIHPPAGEIPESRLEIER